MAWELNLSHHLKQNIQPNRIVTLYPIRTEAALKAAMFLMALLTFSIRSV